MKRFPLYAALVAASLSFAACGNDAADNEDMATDTMMTPADGMATDGTMNGSMDGTTMSSDTMMMNGGGGTMNADGSMSSDGSMQGSGSMQGGSGSTSGSGSMQSGGSGSMQGSGSSSTTTSAGSVQGKVLTTDGTVKDRDGDGRVGTAEVKEEYKQGRSAVKKEYKEVKKDVKD